MWEGPLEVIDAHSDIYPLADVVRHQYKLFVLSLTGDLLGSFAPDPNRGFGVRSVTWHPSGAFLAVAGWDDKVGLTC